MSNFSVDILTPSSVLVRDFNADYLLIPTVNGQINVLPDHTHIVSAITTGIVTLKNSQNSDHYIVTHGICKILKGKVTILSDVAEHYQDVDPERAKKALQLSLDKLNGSDSLLESEMIKFARKKERAEMRLKAAYLR